MKKTYITPIAEKIEFRYSQQVVASGGSCWWQNGNYYTHAQEGCNSNFHEGTGTQVPA